MPFKRYTTTGMCVASKELGLQVANHCRDIVSVGGLSYLQHVMTAWPDNVQIQRRVARVIANITALPDLHEEIIRTGITLSMSKLLKC